MKLIQSNILVAFILFASLSFLSLSESKHKKSYAEEACKVTTHRNQCINLLKSYSNTAKKSFLKWAKGAVQVSLDEAKDTKKYLTELKNNTHMMGENKMGISSCIEDLENTLRELQQSFDILNKIRTKGFKTQIRFVHIHLSAAVNYYSSCLDNYEGQKGNEIDTLRHQIWNSSHSSEIALDFVHKVDKIGSKSLSDS